MDTERSDLHSIKIFLSFITLVISVQILRELKTIFLPFFIALLLYFLFNGIVIRLINLRFPKVLIVTFLLLFIFILFYFLGLLIFSGVSTFIENFPNYSDKISNAASGIFAKIELPIKNLDELLKDFNWSKTVNSIITIISDTFGSFASFIGNFVLIIIFLVFMLAGRNSLILRVHKSFSEKKTDQILYIINSIENQVQHYLLIKSFVSILTAIISGVILYIGGFDFVLFSALLIFILNYIPNFGSIVATTFPVLTGLINEGLSLKVVLVTAGLIITQMIIGNVIEPKVTGRNLNISPIVILISLIFWGYVWGVIGMMLAVPLTSAIKIIFSQIDGLKPIASMISAE